MEAYENYNQVTMMLWELNPRKRNQNNIIKVNSLVDLKVGDIILGDLKNDISFSTYRIEEITESRPSTLKGYTYYSLKTSFKYQPAIKFLDGLSRVTKHRVNTMIEKQKEIERNKPKQYRAKSA